MQLIFYISVFNILMVKVKEEKKKSDLITDQISGREKSHVERRQIQESQGTKSTDTILCRPWEGYRCPGKGERCRSWLGDRIHKCQHKAINSDVTSFIIFNILYMSLYTVVAS